jgi:hypothetical protein
MEYNCVDKPQDGQQKVATGRDHGGKCVGGHQQPHVGGDPGKTDEM